MHLSDLGTRVSILGPSNSGKSTLAAALGRALDLPVIHLDQLRHLPRTRWQLRPDSEFSALHDAAISAERWIVEGNYLSLLPKRLARTTGLVLLDASMVASVTRYLRRTWSSRERIGGLDGNRDRVSSSMLGYILGAGQRSRRSYRELFAEASCPKVLLPSRRALERFYRDEKLLFPGRK